MTIRQLLNNAALSALAQLFWRGALMLAFLIFARQLAVGDFADLAYFNITLTSVATIAAMGAGPAAARIYAGIECGEAQMKEEVAALGALALAGALVAILLFATILDAPTLGNMGGFGFNVLIWLIVMGSIPANALNGLERYASMAIAALAGAIILLAFAYSWGNYADGALFALMIGYAAKLFADHVAAWGPWSRTRQASMRAFKTVAKLMGSMAISGAAFAIGVWGLATWVKDHLGEAEFARYAIGMQWYAIGAFGATNITRVLMPLQVRQVAGAADGSSAVRVGAALAILSSLLLALLLWVGQGPLGAAYGDSIGTVGTIIPWFVAAAASIAVSNIIANRFLAANRSSLWMWVSLAWAAMLLILPRVMTPTSLFGVLAILVSANIIMTLVGLALAKRVAIA